MISNNPANSQLNKKKPKTIKVYDHKRYRIEGKIGEGSYGIVEKALDQQINRYVAIKTMKNVSLNESLPHFILREFDVLRQMEDQHGIVQLLDAYHENSYCPIMQRNQLNIRFVFPFFKDGDLNNFMKQPSYKNHPLPTHMAIDFIEQILSALQTLHSRAYMHRDLKPQNLLVRDSTNKKHTSGKEIVLADFGLSRMISCPPHTMSKQIQSLWYRAPEVLLDNLNYTQSVDIWSVGVIFLEMMNGQGPPFYGSQEIEQLMIIFRKRGTPTPQTLSNYKNYGQLQKMKLKLPKFEKPELVKSFGYGIDELIDQMLEVDSTKRPTSSVALSKIKEIRAEFESEFEGGPTYK